MVDLISSGVYELRVGLCEAVDEPVLRYASWLGTAALAALSATLLLKVVPHARFGTLMRQDSLLAEGIRRASSMQVAYGDAGSVGSSKAACDG